MLIAKGLRPVWRCLFLGTVHLSACSSGKTSLYPSTAACMHDTVFDYNNPGYMSNDARFTHAINVCGEKVPDLTGDTILQVMAVAYGYNFKVNIAEDTRLKIKHREDLVFTGSLLPISMILKPATVAN